MNKPKFFGKINSFLKEVILEIKKINWLTRQEVLKYTFIVIGISVTVAIYLGGLDFLFATIIRRFVI